MKFLKPTISVLFYLFVMSCSNEQPVIDDSIVEEESEDQPVMPEEPTEPETEVYFEIAIGDNINTQIADNWLLIHDIDGKLIDYKSFEKTDTLRFEKSIDSIPDTFTVTEFFVGTLTGRAPFTLKSYTEVTKGSSWVLGILNYVPSPYTEPEVTGNFDITVSGEFLAPSMQVISNNEGNGQGNGAHSISTNTTSGDWVYEKTAELFENNDYYLTLMNGLGQTRYVYLPDVKNEDIFNLNYESFSEFDSEINMELPVTSKISFSLRGYSEIPTTRTSPGYDFYQIPFLTTGQEINSSFKLGYLGNTFDSYSLYLTAILEDYSYWFTYFGSELPKDLMVPERPVFNIDNPDIYNFKFSTDLDYKRIASSWISAPDSANPDKRSTKWSVFSSSNSTSIIGILPEEITSMYPEIDISTLTPQSTALYLESDTHNEFIDAFFGGEDYTNSFKTSEYFTFNYQP